MALLVGYVQVRFDPREYTVYRFCVTLHVDTVTSIMLYSTRSITLLRLMEVLPLCTNHLNVIRFQSTTKTTI